MEQGREVQLQQMLTTQDRLTHQLQLTEAETLVCAYSISVKTTAPDETTNSAIVPASTALLPRYRSRSCDSVLTVQDT